MDDRLKLMNLGSIDLVGIGGLLELLYKFLNSDKVFLHGSCHLGINLGHVAHLLLNILNTVKA